MTFVQDLIPPQEPRVTPEEVIEIFSQGCGNSPPGQPWGCGPCYVRALSLMLRHGFTMDESEVLLRGPKK